MSVTRKLIMSSCPSCEAKIELYKAIQLLTVKKIVNCPSCSNKLMLDQSKMKNALAAFYAVGFFMGMHMYKNDFSPISILLFFTAIIASIAILSKKIKIKKSN